MKLSLGLLILVLSFGSILHAQPPGIKKGQSKIVTDTMYLKNDTVKVTFTVRVDGEDGGFYSYNINGYAVISQYVGKRVEEKAVEKYYNHKWEGIKQKILGLSASQWQE